MPSDPLLWSAATRLATAIPTLRLFDISASTCRPLPAIPRLIAPLGLNLVSFKFAFDEAVNIEPFLTAIIGGRADLREVLRVSAHNAHLRSLVVEGLLEDPRLVSCCTRLERFECQYFSSRDLAEAVPRTIKVLAIANPTPIHNYFWGPPRAGRSTYWAKNLHSFPMLRVFTSTRERQIAMLRERCAELGIEV
ncbi:hypothetical protein C8R45DRAFT_943497 [Mycena sanguinolenta]|nr:hypothetical protein C8R45DRAFT_943497 [Mycena sanguinolenta]